MAVPDPDMLLLLKLPQVSLLGGLSVSMTVPVNPVKALTVIVVAPCWPASTADGLDAPIEKLGMFTLNVAVVE